MLQRIIYMHSIVHIVWCTCAISYAFKKYYASNKTKQKPNKIFCLSWKAYVLFIYYTWSTSSALNVKNSKILERSRTLNPYGIVTIFVSLRNFHAHAYACAGCRHARVSNTNNWYFWRQFFFFNSCIEHKNENRLCVFTFEHAETADTMVPSTPLVVVVDAAVAAISSIWSIVGSPSCRSSKLRRFSGWMSVTLC